MKLIGKILGAVARIFARKQTNNFIPHDKVVILRPDGTWIVSDAKQKSPAPISSYYGMPSYNNFTDYYDGILLGPPDNFPLKTELREKLDKCLEAGVISSCHHKNVGNGIYVLELELPCDKKNINSYNQYRLFVKAMEEKYNFITIKEEKSDSTICSQSYYLVTFEYDPRRTLLTKK